MNNLLLPFAALRPLPELAESVLAPPYDVLNDMEARERAKGKPNSFLHISKPQIDLSKNMDPYSDDVYKKGEENFKKLISSGVLFKEKKPCYYIYRIESKGHQQTGIACVCSVDAYESNIIKKHEHTRPIKESDRVKQISILKAQTGPVLLVHKTSNTITKTIKTFSSRPPEYRLLSDDGNIHSLWIINYKNEIDQLSDNYNSLNNLYIADGHHRSAAASRVANSMKKNINAQYFLSVIFPEEELHILSYNRLIKDLNSLSVDELIEKIMKSFNVLKAQKQFMPESSNHFGMYLKGDWYQLTLKKELLLNKDPISNLDVSILHSNIIEPLLGISNPRTDSRIDFVGGIRGLEELSYRVDSGEMAIAFSLFPTKVSDLMLVADSNKVMPPKSTWFEPKLVDGLLSHILD